MHEWRTRAPHFHITMLPYPNPHPDTRECERKADDATGVRRGGEAHAREDGRGMQDGEARVDEGEKEERGEEGEVAGVGEVHVREGVEEGG